LLSISQILQVSTVIILFILITLTLYSGKVFSHNKKLYFLIFSAGLLFVSFISLEAVLQIYLMKFYLQFGWSALSLFTLIFIILASPFIGKIINVTENLIISSKGLQRTVIKKQVPIHIGVEITQKSIPVSKVSEPVEKAEAPVKPAIDDVHKNEEIIHKPDEQTELFKEAEHRSEQNVTSEASSQQKTIKKPLKKAPVKHSSAKKRTKTRGKKK